MFNFLVLSLRLCFLCGIAEVLFVKCNTKGLAVHAYTIAVLQVDCVAVPRSYILSGKGSLVADAVHVQVVESWGYWLRHYKLLYDAGTPCCQNVLDSVTWVCSS